MKYIVGIDEVGRGALAGPVVVAAVAIPRNYNSYPKHLPRLRDSKGLSPRQRKLWYAYILNNPQFITANARIYQKKIDKLNISRSANLAASRALDSLIRQIDTDTPLSNILLDGGLYLEFEEHQCLPAKTIIHGDQRRNPIKLASIVAKVVRDRYLETLGNRYPHYGFHSHKGYGTSMHLRAIQRFGLLDIHRLTYTRRWTNLKFKTLQK